MIAAGGTGGHIFPALAIAHELDSKYNIIWIGGKVGLENKIIPKHCYPLVTINIGGLRGNGIWAKLLLPMRMLRALLQSIFIIMKDRPDLIVGFGGYVTFPIGVAAKFLGIPLIIHEQNSVAGLSNQVLAKISNKVLTAFDGVLSSKKTVIVGNPIRQAIAQLPPPEQRYDLNDSKLKVLIIGGSLGAQVFNQMLPKILAENRSKIGQIIHQVGKNNVSMVQANYAAYNLNVQVTEFIDDMAMAYANSDLLICRAGASTIAEVSAVGICAIFIPYPYAVDDHQTWNAKFLTDNAAGFLINQSRLDSQELSNLLQSLSKIECLSVAQKAFTFGIKNSTDLICRQLRSLV